MQYRSQESDYFMAKDAWTGDYAAMKRQMWVMIDARDFDGAYAHFIGSSAVIGPITNGLTNSSKLNEGWADETHLEADRLYAIMTIVQIASMVICAVLAVLMTLYISGMISKPLVTLTAFMKRVGQEGASA